MCFFSILFYERTEIENLKNAYKLSLDLERKYFALLGKEKIILKSFYDQSLVKGFDAFCNIYC